MGRGRKLFPPLTERKRHTKNLKGHEVEASEAIELRKNWSIAITDAVNALQKPIGPSIKKESMDLVASTEKANTKKKFQTSNSIKIQLLIIKYLDFGLEKYQPDNDAAGNIDLVSVNVIPVFFSTSSICQI